jgi:hypothetical protein
LVFKKNANFFSENWEKIAEYCDHNIDPRPVDCNSAEAAAIFKNKFLKTNFCAYGKSWRLQASSRLANNGISSAGA